MTTRPSFHPSACAALLGSLLLGGCATGTPPAPTAPLMPAVRQAFDAPPAAAKPAEPGPSPGAAPAAAAAAAAKDNRDAELLAQPAVRSERRFSLVLAAAAPEQLFMALLNDTPLSVAVDPAVKGPLSITLKDVTLREALELLRELYNLEYKVIGRHILVSPAQLQTRIYTVDYPSFNRTGRSELRVVSGSITGSGGSSGSSGAAPGNSTGGGGAGSTMTSAESSRVATSQRSDLWQEIENSLKLLVGDKDGRQVVVSPQSGNIVVRAQPREQRLVQEYLDTMHASVQRQVMLEAKVVEVQLRDSERSGINWAAFKNNLSQALSVGVLGSGAQLNTDGALRGGLVSGTPGQSIVADATASGSVLGLAFQTRNFAAVLEFLATQGQMQVLSSPRIATMNNQKAVLKVGTDDFFVTAISTTTTPVGNTSQTTPSVTVQPFFSGISLDVTPHITADGFITLHIRPAISNVTERPKVLNLGTIGNFTLPLASSDINETDAVVRAKDGNIIALGGLMRQASSGSDSGMPGVDGSWRKIFGGQSTALSEKRELVILLKPTIIDPSKDDPTRNDALARLLEWTEQQRK